MKKSIKIGKNKYSITQVNLIEKDPNVLGKIKHDKQKIFIKKQNKKEAKDTLYHEIAHGIIVDLAFASSENNVKIKNIRALSELNNNEGFIEYFGNVLRNMFKLK